MAKSRLRICVVCGKVFRFRNIRQSRCSRKCINNHYARLHADRRRVYQLQNKNSMRRRYTEHRSNARNRGIPFLLTFEEWSALWEQSGKWEQRGWRKGEYVMARPGDKGAYEVGNVIICLAEDNRAERNRNYPHA